MPLRGLNARVTPHDHALLQMKTVGERNDPIGRHSDILAETAGSVHAQIIAGNDDIIPRPEPTTPALLDDTRRIDTGSRFAWPYAA